MQLGKALVGAIIGAALGIGVLIAVFLLFQLDQVWLAVVVALLTGLGVRTLVSTSGHASYLRGALTGIVALAAYVVGWYAVAQVAQARAAATPQRPARVAAQEAEGDAEADASTEADATVPEPVRPVDRGPASIVQPKALPPGQNPMDYVWLGIAALVAYELGRGSGTARTTVIEETVAEVDVPPGTHPDA